MSMHPIATAVEELRALDAPQPDSDRPRRRRRGSNRITRALAIAWLALALLAAIAPGVLSPGDPTDLHTDRVLAPPGSTLLGTDDYGRSVLALVIHGARPALMIGFFSALLAASMGGLFGLIAGYFGGTVDMVLSRLLDVLMCLPGVLLALVIALALGVSNVNLVFSVAIATLPIFARVMRGQVMSIRSRLYIEAARSVGLPARRILTRHILPNSLAPLVVLATVSVGTSIVLASSLSYLGLGPHSSVPDWGQLLANGQPNLAIAWWISTFAGLAITLTVVSVSLLGDWLRDRLDVS